MLTGIADLKARPKSLARRAAYAGWRKELATFSNPT